MVKARRPTALAVALLATAGFATLGGAAAVADDGVPVATFTQVASVPAVAPTTGSAAVGVTAVRGGSVVDLSAIVRLAATSSATPPAPVSPASTASTASTASPTASADAQTNDQGDNRASTIIAVLGGVALAAVAGAVAALRR